MPQEQAGQNKQII